MTTNNPNNLKHDLDRALISGDPHVQVRFIDEDGKASVAWVSLQDLGLALIPRVGKALAQALSDEGSGEFLRQASKTLRSVLSLSNEDEAVSGT